MNSIMAYCRPGYENDTANELTSLYSERGIYGYPDFIPKQGFTKFQLYEAKTLDKALKAYAIDHTVFPRQLIAVFASTQHLEKEDRVGQLLALLEDCEIPDITFGAFDVEYPDTEDGKTLAKFCRKFTVPMRQALRKKGILLPKENINKPKLHIFFESFATCYIGYSYPTQSSPHHLGICRLKFPADAPSRSTLKLEDAIVNMLTDKERKLVFREGARGVDLGACPGGWTYQLVTRGMYVEAIDNGLVDESLMKTGLVEHHAADGFTYKPQYGRVDLLVCDMIEQPDRVAKLMANWLVKGWTTHAIFNLKLPMKRRFETVSEAMQAVKAWLNETSDTFNIRVRHLYHDRDEVTVTVIRTSKEV